MNNLPNEMPCQMCPRGIMKKIDKGHFHQYYQCGNSSCRDIVGLPLMQYKEDESSTDFGSGSYKSERNQDE